ncbi:MAG: hypothetical protein WAL48_03135, partial [Xanthobacteraceae bacterium]
MNIMFPPVNHETSWPLHAAQINNAAAVLIIPRVTRRSALCRRFEVPASPAASSSRNFKSISGTRATSKSGHRFRVRSRANYRWRMIFSANRRP